MDYPEALRPSGVEHVDLISGRHVAVPMATAVFARWSGAPLADTYGGKTVLEFNGEALFAELVILRHLEAAGWKGAWIDTYRNRVLTGFGRPALLPAEQQAMLNRIFSRAGSRHGCFDVLAWRGSDRLFAEAKRGGKDRLRDTQVRWLSAALDDCLPTESFLVVEWSAATEERRLAVQ